MKSIRRVAFLCIAACIFCAVARAADSLDELRQTLQDY